VIKRGFQLLFLLDLARWIAACHYGGKAIAIRNIGDMPFQWRFRKFFDVLFCNVCVMAMSSNLSMYNAN
jgi:hypothetical protein